MVLKLFLNTFFYQPNILIIYLFSKIVLIVKFINLFGIWFINLNENDFIIA
jgi:hypothetical protein